MKNFPSWLNGAVFYEIFPASFMDADGDGIGDIRGMISKLDYIRDLGCNAIWINPWYESLFKDGGYDVTDFYSVAKRYGTNDIAKEFLIGAHERGIKVLLDLVPCHTAINHPWFIESCKKERNEYTDRYIWNDNVWVIPDFTCLRGISDRNGSVMTSYFDTQPALNYGFLNPKESWQQRYDEEGPQATKKELHKIIRFWLDMGFDGFRIDMASHIYKDDPTYEGHRKFWGEIRHILDTEYPECALLSEWGRPKLSIPAGFHMDFLSEQNLPSFFSIFRDEKPFFSKYGEGDVTGFTELFENVYDTVKKDGLIFMASGTHDLWRLKQYLSDDEVKLCFMFLFTMSGVPSVYYGDEIGMRYLRERSSVEGGFHRTGSRTPMQWERGKKNHGFSESDTPYIVPDLSEDAPTVSEQAKNENSLLNFVKKMIAFRKSHPALWAESGYKTIYAEKNKYPYIYERTDGKERLRIVLNPSGRKVRIPVRSDGEALFVFGNIDLRDQTIAGGSGVVIREKKSL